MGSKINEPVKTHLPMEFWTQMVRTMDDKVKNVASIYGYGKIGFTVILFNGKVKDIVFNDEVRVRQNEPKP